MSGPLYGGRTGDPSLGLATYVTVEIPSLLKRPAAGNAAYRAAVILRNGLGTPEDPDGATVYARLLKSDGTVLASRLYTSNAMAIVLPASTSADFAAASGWLQQTTQVAVGFFEAFIQVQTADTEQELTLEVGYVEAGAVVRELRRFRVGDAADLDTVATDAASAAAAVGGANGIGAGTDAAAAPGAAGTVQAHLRETQENIDIVESKIGTPVNTGGTASLAAILGDMANSAVVVRLSSIKTDSGNLVGRVGNPSDGGLVTLVAYLGTGADAPGTAGTAGQSLHAKLRKALELVGLATDASTADTVLGLIGQPGDAVAAAGAEGSVQAHVRQALVDLAAVLADTGDGTDIAVTAGLAGSIHAHVRNAQVNIDTALTRIGAPAVSLVATLGTPVGASLAADVAAVQTEVNKLGAVGDASAPSGAAGSVHAHVRHAQDRLGLATDASTADTVLGLLGQPADPATAAGVEGSTASKLRAIQDYVGNPGPFASLHTQTVNVDGGLVLESGTLDGAFVHTTTVFQSSTLDATNDWYSGQRCTVIKVVGAAGRPRRTSRSISSYDAANKRITLATALPVAPVNGDMFVVTPA